MVQPGQTISYCLNMGPSPALKLMFNLGLELVDQEKEKRFQIFIWLFN